MYIADKDNDRVREADLINNVITTFAGTGIGGYDGDGLASQKKIWNPYDTFVDSRGHVYIADTYNHRVRRVVQ